VCASFVRSVAIVLIGTTLAARPATANDDELLRVVQDGHRAAIESIRTFSCRAELKFEPTQPLARQTAEYWRSGRDFRVRVKSFGSRDDECDTLVRDGVVKQYESYPWRKGESARHGLIGVRDQPFSCNPWAYGLLTFPGQTKYRVPLDELLTDAHRVQSVRRDTRDGRALIHLDLSHDRARLDIWFDPAVNYLARIVRVRAEPPAGGPIDSVATVTEFREVAPGIYFPTRVHQQSTTGGDAKSDKWAATFTDITVNKPLPPDSLTLRFPPGIMVSDLVRNGVFRTDERGEPTLPALNSRGVRYTLGTSPPVPSDYQHLVPQPASVSLEEPRSLTRWLLPAGLVLVAVGVLLKVARRRAAVRNAD
jgi:hypothetical protein